MVREFTWQMLNNKQTKNNNIVKIERAETAVGDKPKCSPVNEVDLYHC